MIRNLKYNICALLLFLLQGLAVSLSAQNFIGVSLGGNLTHVADNISLTSPKIGGGGNLGFVYELQYRHFLFRTELQYGLQIANTALQNESFAQPMIDTRGVPFVYRGEIRNRTDRLNMHRIAIPVLLGGTWNGFYFLAGVKAAFIAATTTMQKANLYTAGDYDDRYYQWLEDMPNHGYFTNIPVESKHRATLKQWNLLGYAEMGYTVSLKSRQTTFGTPLLRIGIFAEGDILSFMTAGNTPAVLLDFSQYAQPVMNNIYTAQNIYASQARLIAYGLKITFLFPLSGSYGAYHGSRHATQKYPCRCYEQ